MKDVIRNIRNPMDVNGIYDSKNDIDVMYKFLCIGLVFIIIC